QRITTIYRLEPLTELEITEYVKFRLGVAGAEQPGQLFSPEALAQLAFQSGGVPRLVNAICYRALVRAYRCQEESISATRIKEAATDIDLAESHRNISNNFLETAAARFSPISDKEDEEYEPKWHKERATPDGYISRIGRDGPPDRFAETVGIPAADTMNPSDMP